MWAASVSELAESRPTLAVLDANILLFRSPAVGQPSGEKDFLKIRKGKIGLKSARKIPGSCFMLNLPYFL